MIGHDAAIIREALVVIQPGYTACA